MDDAADQSVPEQLARRAGRLADDAESRIPVLIALVAAMALQLAMPDDYTLIHRWPLIVMEAILLVVMAVTDPVRVTRGTRVGAYALLAAITIDNRIGGRAGYPHPVGPGEQRCGGAARQRCRDLHHERRGVRHLVLETRQRRTDRPTQGRAPLSGLHVPADG